MSALSKTEAGEQLLSALDAYIGAVMAEQKKQDFERSMERSLKASEELRSSVKKASEDTETKHGPYTQVLIDLYRSEEL